MFREASSFLVLVSLCVFFASATKVKPCSNGKTIDDPNQVTISGCSDPPCQLKRRTEIGIEQRFIPEKDVHTLLTTVYAKVFGVPLPFIGVDGSNACDLVYHTDGTKASCPLTKDTEYVYKNSFPILPAYPKLDLVVHWALTEGTAEVACFEVPAKITA